MKRRVTAFVLGVGLIAAVATALPAAASAGWRYADKPVTRTAMKDYCRSLGFERVILQGKDAYGWRCVDSDGNRHGFSVKHLCEQRFGDNRMVDRWLKFSAPRSWVCFGPAAERGGLNLWAYCKGHGFQRAKLSGRTVDDWRCVRSDGSSKPILTSARTKGLSMAEACRKRWGPEAKDRVADYYNAGSVRCWTPA